jgi:hypothetical protein
MNSGGDLLDRPAAGRLPASFDAAATADELVRRYEGLWNELTTEDSVPSAELWQVNRRLERLNDLGFDTEELELVTEADGQSVRFRPTVVEEGHHRRELARLTGIVAHENQARRLLRAMQSYGAWLVHHERKQVPEAVIAYRWLTERWEPVLAAIPEDLRGRLEDAQLYHEILEHCWYLSEQAGRDVGLTVATREYVDRVLRHRPDERSVLTGDTAELPAVPT